MIYFPTGNGVATTAATNHQTFGSFESNVTSTHLPQQAFQLFPMVTPLGHEPQNNPTQQPSYYSPSPSSSSSSLATANSTSSPPLATTTNVATATATNNGAINLIELAQLSSSTTTGLSNGKTIFIPGHGLLQIATNGIVPPTRTIGQPIDLTTLYGNNGNINTQQFVQQSSAQIPVGVTNPNTQTYYPIYHAPPDGVNTINNTTYTNIGSILESIQQRQQQQQQQQQQQHQSQQQPILQDISNNIITGGSSNQPLAPILNLASINGTKIEGIVV